MGFGDQGHGNKQRRTWSHGGLHLHTYQRGSWLTEILHTIVFIHTLFSDEEIRLHGVRELLPAPQQGPESRFLICLEESAKAPGVKNDLGRESLAGAPASELCLALGDEGPAT